LTYSADDIRLVIVGDGPQRRALERLAHRLGVGHRVEFRGRVDRERVFQLWAGAAGAVFTGLREEGGLALAEAMLCGVPVVVLAHGGARTIAAGALDPSRVALIAPGPLPSVARHIGEAMTRFCERDSSETRPNLDVARSLQSLHAAVGEALARHPAR
jgi:glycosyltransferase involved in cell wall biosynthesis